TQLRRFDGYPKHCPWWEDAALLAAEERGALAHEFVLHPGCTSATLILSHTQPQAADGPIELGIGIEVRDAANGTAAEDHQRGGWHHRINTGPDLDRRLRPSDERARVEIDMGQGIVDQHWNFSLC